MAVQLNSGLSLAFLARGLTLDLQSLEPLTKRSRIASPDIAERHFGARLDVILQHNIATISESC